MRRTFSFENIIGFGFFIFGFLLATINFSTFQRINTNFSKIEGLNALRDTIFEMMNIMQMTLISTILIIVGLIFVILGLIRD